MRDPEINQAEGVLEFAARSDPGRVRENNEDSFRIAPELNLFVLCDGMGGQASGEVASRLATETILAHCREAEVDPGLPLVGEIAPGASDASNRLASAIRTANRVIYEEAQKNEAQQGMGATVVAAWLDGERLSVAHAGDSRIYRMRGGELEQLTRDHSFIGEQVRQGMMTKEEASRSTLQNVLLRALGAEPEIEVELDEELVRDEDTFLLCSDGLTHELSDAQIASVLAATSEPEEAAEKLVEMANQAGGEDNITVIVVRRAARMVGAMARLGRWFKGN